MLLRLDPMIVPVEADIPPLENPIHDLLVFRVLLGHPEPELLGMEVRDNRDLVLLLVLGQHRGAIAAKGETLQRPRPDQPTAVVWTPALFVEPRK